MDPDSLEAFEIDDPARRSGDGVHDDPVRDSILAAIRRLLEEKGYPDITTDQIAAEARVSKATIYGYWRTKHQMIIAAAAERFGPMEPPDLGSFQKEIHWILEHRMGDYRRPGTLRMVGGLVGAAATDSEWRAVFNRWIEHLSRAVRRSIQRGIARGEVRDDVDILALETLSIGVLSRAVIRGRPLSESTVADAASMLAIAAGCAARLTPNRDPIGRA